MSFALQDTAGTPLGQAVAPLTAVHPGQSGLLRLTDGLDAYAVRARLADVAQRSLDVQYYLWRKDLTGTLLFDALRRAAVRGVRVRLLLDDNNTAGLDGELAALVAQPGIEVRLFNPYAVRDWRPLQLVAVFGRLNRRMHNKSFTADNQVTVVGGRNIGDEYFGAGEALQFIDLDVLAIGPVVDAVSRDFDRYWASDAAYPAQWLLPRAEAPRAGAPDPSAANGERSVAAQAYADAVARQALVEQLRAHRVPFEWAVTTLLSDSPDKVRGTAVGDGLLWTHLRQVLKAPARALSVISPYFVPGPIGTAALVRMAQNGVRVTVLTNAFEATDVPVVHAGYAKYRLRLLEGGVVLYELKRASESSRPKALFRGGSSDSSLHGKAVSIDRKRAFVGSFNFDPRSATLNTELGLIVESPTLASAIADAVAGKLAAQAYRLRLTPGGHIEWIESVGTKTIVHETEPSMTAWQRLGIALMECLPIEWLL